MKVHPSLCAVAVLILSAISALYGAQVVAEHETLDEIEKKLSSTDISERRAAAKSYAIHAWKYGNDGLKLFSLAIENEDEFVKLHGLYGLQRFVVSHARNRQQRDAVLSQNSQVQKILVDLMCYPEEKIRFTAASLATRLLGDTPELEGEIVGCIGDVKDEVVLVDYVRLLSFEGIQSSEAVTYLLEIASGERSDVVDAAAIAAEALVKMKNPPERALPLAMNLVERDDTFAKPALIKEIARRDTDAVPYLPRLKDLREKLGKELAMPASSRTVTVYNEEYTVEVLKDAISYIETLHRQDSDRSTMRESDPD